MKKIIYLSILSILFTLLTPFSVNNAFAATYYPGTTQVVKAGDVLYSSKGWSTGFVGHVAIVGDDLNVYHSTPAVTSGAIGESLTNYLTRYSSTDVIKVYRYFPTNQVGPFIEPVEAGKRARLNVNKVIEYSITWDEMALVTQNYCSKFVWQAWYFGAGVNIDKPYLGNYMTHNSSTIFAPSSINLSTGSNGSIFEHVVNFTK